MQKQAETKTLTIYIYMDDSGKLSTKEKISVFAGIAFLDKAKKDTFARKYKSIIKQINCSYCHDKKEQCNHSHCPEIKSLNIEDKHKRRIINLCKEHCTYAVIINNAEVYSNILSSKAGKGRYTDYAQKRIIKQLIIDLISNGKLNPNENLDIIINIDQQSTKSNGYYNLKESIDEELSRGIINYDYGFVHKAIIYGKLNIAVNYLDSKKVYGIQAADIIAGQVRKVVLYSKSHNEMIQKINSFISSKLFLPEKK